MNFEQFTGDNFALARDFLYLAALSLGAGTGCILNRFRKKSTARFRNLSVTAGFCFFSAFVVALTAAAICSNWTIFREIPLYLYLGITTLIVALAFRFPKAVGFPLFIAAGFFLVWIGFSCLRFSPVDSNGEGRLMHNENGFVHIQLPPPPGTQSEVSFYFEPDGENSSLEFRAIYICISREFPLIGGESRGSITEVLGNNERLYFDEKIERRIFPGAGWNRILGRIILFDEVTGRLAIGELFPGVSRTILLDAAGLAFH